MAKRHDPDCPLPAKFNDLVISDNPSSESYLRAEEQRYLLKRFSDSLNRIAARPNNPKVVARMAIIRRKDDRVLILYEMI